MEKKKKKKIRKGESMEDNSGSIEEIIEEQSEKKTQQY